MNIEEAIKQNKQWLKEHPHLGEVNGYAALPPYSAIQLGIEGLERINIIRGKLPYCWSGLVGLIKEPLPSEEE